MADDDARESIARLKAIAKRYEDAAREAEEGDGHDPIEDWDDQEEVTLNALPESLSPIKVPVAMTLAIPPEARSRTIITVVAILGAVVVVLALADRIPGWVTWLISKLPG